MREWQAKGSRRRIAAILFSCSLLLAWQAKARESGDVERHTLAIATSDSEYFPIGVAISSLIKLKLLPNQSIDLPTIGTERHFKRLELLLDDQVQFALTKGTFVGDLPAGFDRDGTLQVIAGLSSFDNDNSTSQSSSASTIETGHFLVVCSDVRGDVVYNITKTIFDHLGLLSKIDQKSEQITLEQATKGLPMSIHEGALHFDEEREISMLALTDFSGRNPIERHKLPEEARDDVNDQTVGIPTDEISSGSSGMISDLATGFKDDDGLRLISITSGDSLNHLGDLVYREGVDLVIIQAGLLSYAREQAICSGLVDEVDRSATLFKAETDLLVKGSIETIDDNRASNELSAIRSIGANKRTRRHGEALLVG